MDKNELASVAGHGKYRRVEVKRVVNAPIDKVWNAITNADEVEKWWAAGEIDPKEGGQVKLGLGGEEADCGGLGLDGTIKVFQPPHIFEFTWHEAYDPAMGLVRFDLVELENNQTLVTLVNSVPSTDAVPAAAGWHEIVESLGTYVGGGKAAPLPKNENRFSELKAIYEAALG